MHKVTKLIDEKVNQQAKQFELKLQEFSDENKKTNKQQFSAANVNMIEIQKTISTLDKKQVKVDEKIDEISDQKKKIFQAIKLRKKNELVRPNKYK